MIPTLMMSVGATWAIPGVDAQALGVVGIVFNYQARSRLRRFPRDRVGAVNAVP
jgi:hypothetical protein